MAASQFRRRSGRTYERRPLSDRLWAKVEKTDGCWLWTGAVAQFGHGKIIDWPSGKYKSTHRVSWELAHGPVPMGMQVCHRCDVPRCVRPDHLFLGTQADNLADMRSKGRAPVGDRNGQARLSDDDVRLIHAAVKAGERTRDIAVRFGIGKGHVLQVARATRWRHLSLEPILVGPRSGNSYKTHCANGHAFSGNNLHVDRTGRRHCRACWREQKRREAGRQEPR